MWQNKNLLSIYSICMDQNNGMQKEHAHTHTPSQPEPQTQTYTSKPMQPRNWNTFCRLQTVLFSTHSFIYSRSFFFITMNRIHIHKNGFVRNEEEEFFFLYCHLNDDIKLSCIEICVIKNRLPTLYNKRIFLVHIKKTTYNLWVA